MALIKCPECRKKISDQCAYCPKCGYPIKNSYQNEMLETQNRENIEEVLTKKKVKRNKMKAIIPISIACVVIAFIIVLISVVIPNAKYNNAIALMEEEEYTYAIKAFENLDGYKDSVDKIEECKGKIYNTAIDAMSSGEYTKATEFLEKLDGYKDSQKKSKECHQLLNLKNVSSGDTIKLGRYEQDNDETNGLEEIEWQVLDVKRGKVLVISKYSLDCKPYNDEEGADVTWETSSLRSWLNGEFFDIAFSENQKRIISETRLSNIDNEIYNTEGGNDTKDKIFISGMEEIAEYFPSDSDCYCKPTAYANTRGVWILEDGTSCWWLRWPGYSQSSAAVIGIGGGVYPNGDSAHQTRVGVRPTLWIDLRNIK